VLAKLDGLERSCIHSDERSRRLAERARPGVALGGPPAHWLLLVGIKVLEKNLNADCSRLGILGYALTPCSSCRFYAARLLLARQAAPEWLVAECRHDSGADCRALVDKATG
jgi:hypothetical protein